MAAARSRSTRSSSISRSRSGSPDSGVDSAVAAHPDELNAEQVSAAVTSFALLADPTRVRMLWALREDEMDVASLAAVPGCRPTVASQHLSKLRFAGLVSGTRHGQRVPYRLRGGMCGSC